MPLGIKEEPKAVAQKDDASKKAKTSNSDADDAAAILAQMQAKEDGGDCAFC